MNNNDVVRALYAAINGNDFDAAALLLDEKVLRVEPDGFPTSGTYVGVEVVIPQWKTARATWAEGTCSPERLLESGNKVVALIHVHVRLKDKTEWIDAHIADGFVVNDGKILEMHTFAKAKEALAWAGIENEN